MKIGNGGVLFCNNTKWDWKGKDRRGLILFDLCFLLWNGLILMFMCHEGVQNERKENDFFSFLIFFIGTREILK